MSVGRIVAAIVRFLDTITPPFLDPEAIDDEIAWLYPSNTSPPLRALSDDDYIVRANTQEAPCTTNKPSTRDQ